MKKYILLAILATTTIFNYAQTTPVYESYRWEEAPDFSKFLDPSEDLLLVKEQVTHEFYFEKDNGLVEFQIEHKAFQLNSDEAIEDFNKVYIPYSGASEILANKARVILPNNSIVELDDSKILEATDDETGRRYKYFAFEGIEKNSVIEYYYIIKTNPRYNGSRHMIQSYYNKKNVSFDLYAPQNLEFALKSYNKLTETTKDALVEGKLHWSLHLPSVDKLEEEETSAYNASRQYLIYKLENNLASNVTGISNYSKVAKNLHAFYYPEISTKTQKAVSKFIAKAGKGNDSDEDKIRALEHYIKTNVYLSNANGEELKDLDEVLSNNVANQVGLLKLYVAVFKEAKISHDLVLTSDRQDLKFDKDFEAHNFLNEFLFYFPEFDTYLAPTESDSRYGFPPPSLTDNYGFFMKEVALGNITSALSSVKYIDAIPANKTVDKMTIDVSFSDDDMATTNIKLNRQMSGYYAMYVQPFIKLAKQESQDEFLESFGTRLDENMNVESMKMLNAEAMDFGVKPLVVELEMSSDVFVEKAGKKYLFKVGDLIGRQIEMYQEKKRVLPVESDFNRSYLRTINITIPDGYKVSNLEDITINNKYNNGTDDILVFDSFYKQEGQMITITADEHYRENLLPLELYEDYRTVINSAADFNKITLVLEPLE